MARHHSHSVAFKRQVAAEFSAGETLHAPSKRHDISRQLIRIWVGKFEAGALDEDAQAADLIQEYEVRIAALERLAGRQALELELLTYGPPRRQAVCASWQAVCLNVSGLRVEPWPRWRSARSTPHKGAGIECHFAAQAHGTPVDCQAISRPPPADLLQPTTPGARRG